MSNCIQLKTSVIKGIRNQLLEQFPDIEPWLNQIMPKKDPVKIVRWYDPVFPVFVVSLIFCSGWCSALFIFCVHFSHEHIEILTVNGELLFFRQREGPFYPTLRLLHKCKLPSTTWLKKKQSFDFQIWRLKCIFLFVLLALDYKLI